MLYQLSYCPPGAVGPEPDRIAASVRGRRRRPRRRMRTRTGHVTGTARRRRAVHDHGRGGGAGGDGRATDGADVGARRRPRQDRADRPALPDLLEGGQRLRQQAGRGLEVAGAQELEAAEHLAVPGELRLAAQAASRCGAARPARPAHRRRRLGEEQGDVVTLHEHAYRPRRSSKSTSRRRLRARCRRTLAAAPRSRAPRRSPRGTGRRRPSAPRSSAASAGARSSAPGQPGEERRRLRRLPRAGPRCGSRRLLEPGVERVGPVPAAPLGRR